MLKIAFLHFAEPYHCYHLTSLVDGVAKLPDCEVVEFVNYDECHGHLAHIRQKLGSVAPRREPLSKSFVCILLERMRFLDAQRNRILRENVARLNEFDVVVATEYTAAALKAYGLKARLVYVSHGTMGRQVGDAALIRFFDLALFSCRKEAEYVVERQWLPPRRVVQVPMGKLDLWPKADDRRETSPFGGAPYTLYNPQL